MAKSCVVLWSLLQWYYSDSFIYHADILITLLRGRETIDVFLKVVQKCWNTAETSVWFSQGQ